MRIFSILLLIIMVSLVSAENNINTYGEYISQDVNMGGVIRQACIKFDPRTGNIPYACADCSATLTIRDGNKSVLDKVAMSAEGNGHFTYPLTDPQTFKINYQYNALYTCTDGSGNEGNISGYVITYNEGVLPGTAQPTGLIEDLFTGEGAPGVDSWLNNAWWMLNNPGQTSSWVWDVTEYLSWDLMEEQYGLDRSKGVFGSIVGSYNELKNFLSTVTGYILTALKIAFNFGIGILIFIDDPPRYTQNTIIPELTGHILAFVSMFWMFFIVMEMMILGLTLHKMPNPTFWPFIESFTVNHLNIFSIVLSAATVGIKLILDGIKTLLEMVGIVGKVSPL